MNTLIHFYAVVCRKYQPFCRGLWKIPCRFQKLEPLVISWQFFCWFLFGTAQVTKLVRANKFVLDTVMYKVGEDAISDAFSRAADAADNTQADGFLSRG